MESTASSRLAMSIKTSTHARRNAPRIGLLVFSIVQNLSTDGAPAWPASTYAVSTQQWRRSYYPHKLCRKTPDRCWELRISLQSTVYRLADESSTRELRMNGSAVLVGFLSAFLVTTVAEAQILKARLGVWPWWRVSNHVLALRQASGPQMSRDAAGY